MKLTDRALLTQLNIRVWTARKYDKRVTEEVARTHGAHAGVGRYNKRLLQSALLEDIQKFANEIRREYYDNTLPWGMDGTQILPVKNYLAFTQQFRQRRLEWEQMVATFVQEYPRLKADAEYLLPNGLYNEDDYPTTIEDKFAMSIAVLPVPDSDFRVALGEAEMEQIRNDVEKRVQAATATAMQEVWHRLYSRVEKMVERLSDPDNVFRDTLIENAREMCEMLPRLNIADDPALEQLRIEVKQRLVVDPDGLRKDKVFRADTAKAAQDVLAKMRGYMGVPA